MFLIQEVIFIANVKPFTPKSVMNQPQTEGRVHHVCTEERRRRFNTLQPLTNNEAQLLVYLKYILLISMVELDHQRSAANTSVNKMKLDIFVLFNIFNYCRFVSYSEFAFHCFNSF